MQRYGIGIIGMGWMGEAHALAYLNYKVKFANTKIHPKLIICSEILEERAKVAQEKFGFEHYSMDWKAVVDHPQVDIVDITAPNALHTEIIEYCLKKGKHINCEKPVGAFPNQTLKAYESLKSHQTQGYNKQTFVGFNYRWAPMVQYAKLLLDSGRLGKVYHYKGSFFSCYAANPLACYSWRFEKENGLGAITDLLSHVIDMAHYLIGDITHVQGNLQTFIKERPKAKEGASHYAIASMDSQKAVVSNDDYVGVQVHFANGAIGFLDASRIFYGPTSKHSFEIFCEKGSILWNFEDMNVLHVALKEDIEDNANMGYKKIYSSPNHPLHANFNPSDGSPLGYDDLKTLEIAHFLENIASKQVVYDCDLKAAAKVANVALAIMQSNKSKQEQAIGALV